MTIHQGTMKNKGKTIKEVLIKHFMEQGYNEIDAEQEVDKLAVEYSEYAPLGTQKKGQTKRKNRTRDFEILINHTPLRSGNLKTLYNVIRNLYFGFGIPYEIFQIDKKHIIPEQMQAINNLQKFYPIDFTQNTKQAIINLKTLYQNIFIDTCFSQISRNYRLYDYLGKGHHNIPEYYFEHYLKIHESIFEAIEDRLALNEKMKYTRILAIPFLEKNKQIANDFNQIATLAFDKCSGETFHHLCKCIDAFGIGKGKRIQFYVTCLPTRNYQFGICDHTFMFSEHYRMTKRDKTIPEYIRLYSLKKKSQESEDLLYIYNIDFKRMTKRSSMRFQSRNHFIEFFKKYATAVKIENNDYAEENVAFINKKIECFNDTFSKNIPLKKLSS